ncbi:unnamed protein product [Medioppia subpectinata]|nr:unnamed protein product [Medioppia subpectinata]CAG2110293.1 unnamed protein product [Medioppia subpectinata]
MCDKLDMKSLNALLNQLDDSSERHLVLSLPKFTIKTEYDLEDGFKRLGLKSVFNSSADLSSINGDKKLHLSQVIHKAFVEIKEEGIQSSELSELLYIPAVNPFVRHIPVKVNKPFLFIIRDNNSDLILMLGQLRVL